MTAALINFITPLLFIVSFGFFVYALFLFLRSFAKKSRPLRMKAIKISILPLVYMVGMLSLFHVLQTNYTRKIMPQVAGVYAFAFNDTFRISYQLNNNNTFLAQSPKASVSGKWEVETNTWRIFFYDQQGKEFTKTVIRQRHDSTFLVFLYGTDTIEMAKQPLPQPIR